jgi:hypothetical protein
MLLRMEYNRTAGHTCDVCQSKLAGFVGYRCNAYDFDVHEACVDYFKETVSFFTHPRHTLKLSRIPNDNPVVPVRWVCDLCRETIPKGSLVYRCVGCIFDVHPLCTMLPQTIRSPHHPEHDLHMVPASGRRYHCCNVCREPLPVCHYACSGSCLFRLHSACVTGAPIGIGQGSAGQVSSLANTVRRQPAVTSLAAGGQRNTSGIGQGSAGQVSSIANIVRRQQAVTSLAAGGQRNTSDGQSKTNTSGNRVAEVILKQAFRVAINTATGGLASPVLDILEAAMD